ncbi:unnamed protein product [Caenorhabditis bovis]|uniref:Ground-like domain-containing protein n=1 Tax=Caenorhabditis bovis TaxID=2654633 RepID=A0A8S1ECL7_9PELO|nr:unnamed protein product [Caenorhabditis bovis]
MNPRTPCDDFVLGSGLEKCSALERLFEISQLEIDTDSPFNLLYQKDSDVLLPIDDNEMTALQREIQQFSNSTNIRLSPKRKQMIEIDLNTFNRINSMISELEVDSSLDLHRRVKRGATAENNCNDEKLRKLIKNNISKDAKTSKKNIQKAANKEFKGHFNVICSPCEFSFVVASQKYCDGFKDGIACFAFLQPPTKLKAQD